jgi:hypothetical protein
LKKSFQLVLPPDLPVQASGIVAKETLVTISFHSGSYADDPAYRFHGDHQRGRRKGYPQETGREKGKEHLLL